MQSNLIQGDIISVTCPLHVNQRHREGDIVSSVEALSELLCVKSTFEIVQNSAVGGTELEQG